MIKLLNSDLRIFTVQPDGKTAKWQGLYSSETVALKDLKIIEMWEG